MIPPKNMIEAAAMLSEVFVFMRAVQSALPPHSEMWKCAGKSCMGIEDSIRMIERIPRASIGQMVSAAPMTVVNPSDSSQ